MSLDVDSASVPSYLGIRDSLVVEARTEELGVSGSSTSHYAECGVSLSNDTLFLASSVGWGCNMLVLCIGAVLWARKRTRVAVVEFHVSPFFSLCTIHV